MDAMTVHEVFCPDCGGWEPPRFEQITAHEGHIRCETCGEFIILLRTEEPIIHN